MKKNLLYVSLLVVLFLSVTGCSTSKRTSSTSTTETTRLKIKDSYGSARSFNDAVQQVCNSVDPSVFDAVIAVDPNKDTAFEQKFIDADTAITNLYTGFKAISPPKSVVTQWSRGLDNLNELKTLVSKVKDQYKEYISLSNESKTSKDPQRNIEIVSRLITLGGEYSKTIVAIQTKFTEVLLIGSSAGINKCHAFEIGQQSK
ncbi:MAG: hypothetical protein U0R17_06165 [Acidimicrobiia bacterium]